MLFYLRNLLVVSLRVLQHNTSLVTLDLSRTAIDSVNYEITKLLSSMASSMYRMLKKNKSLTTLKLSGNCYTCLHVSKIFRGLRYNTTLRHLDLSKMTMTDEAIDALENGIMSKYSLQTLDISGALVSASGADRILNALESASLETLYISYVDPETIDDSVRDKIHLMP